MRQLRDIELEIDATDTIVGLSSAFEGIASMKITKVKNQVLRASEFFNDLWSIYSQLRVDSQFRFGRTEDKSKIIDKVLFIAITAEGSFSGDIDQKLINHMLESYDKTKHDIVVVGHHGVVQLAQKGISFEKYFKSPENDQNIDISPIIEIIQKYKSTTVFYQEYKSLMVQNIKKIELSTAVKELGENAQEDDEVISEATYIFEPSVADVVGYLEESMLHISVRQLIFSSKLAQHASRYKAMSAAHQAADDSLDNLNLQYNRARRTIKDDRLKEIVNGLRKIGAKA